MHPNIEEGLNTINKAPKDPNAPLPYSIALGIKEFGFLSLILFLGFTGFSLCLDKIYSMPDAHKIDEITVHSPVITQVDDSRYTLED